MSALFASDQMGSFGPDFTNISARVAVVITWALLTLYGEDVALKSDTSSQSVQTETHL